MVACVAFGCNNRAKADSGKSFHLFPKDKDLLQKWMVAVRRESWQPSKTSRLCGDHFRPEDFLKRPNSYKRQLRKNAVPTVFYFKINKEERRILEKIVPEQTSFPAVKTESPDFNIETDDRDFYCNVDGYEKVEKLGIP